MKLSLILFFSLLSFTAKQCFAQTENTQFLEKEKGFITTDGSKVLVKKYYGLSENHLYFRIADDKTFYYLDTLDVVSFQDINIGSNKELASKKRPGLMRGIWLGTCIVLGPIGVVGVAGVGELIVYSSNLNIETWATFFTLLPFDTFIFYVVTKDAVEKLNLVKAFKTAKPYLTTSPLPAP
ncbi:MAG: hypothetical protein RLZZ65_1066 [Bacteroidota bacterium]|jgi:hypothetical protein